MPATETMNHPECNAYCRGTRHAQVVFVRADHHGGEMDVLAAFCASVGVRLVSVKIAVEAPFVMPDRGWEPDGAGGWRRDDSALDAVVPDDYSPWLLVWEGA